MGDGLNCDNVAVAEQCSVGDFELEGVLDGSVVRVTRRHGQLSAPESLLDRAALLISMGETFLNEDPGYQLPAGLDEPVQAALTLMRAIGRITSFHIELDDGISLAFAS